MLTERDIVLTPAGLKKVERELERLQTKQRIEVASRIKESKQYGDVSDIGGNSEYEEAKQEQAFVEGQILELKKILSSARVVNPDEIPTDVVGVGTVVTVRDLETHEEWPYYIVGPVEADPEEDRISYESPVGRALLGAHTGDIVEVQAPAGILRYKILEISRAF